MSVLRTGRGRAGGVEFLTEKKIKRGVGKRYTSSYDHDM